MAKPAAAERERRAIIILSEGELSASDNLARAADNLSKHPGALHLRTLQTIRDIAADPSEKIVMVLPGAVESLAQTVLGGTVKNLPAAEPASQLACPECGAAVRPEAAFCPKCGAGLAE